MCPLCYHSGGSLLHCLSTLTPQNGAVYFCCTGLGVTSTGRYPASCPVKPGLSSSGPFRLSSRDHLAWLRIGYFSTGTQTCKVCFFTLPCGRMATQVAFQCGKCEGRRSQSSEARTPSLALPPRWARKEFFVVVNVKLLTFVYMLRYSERNAMPS